MRVQVLVDEFQVPMVVQSPPVALSVMYLVLGSGLMNTRWRSVRS